MKRIDATKQWASRPTIRYDDMAGAEASTHRKQAAPQRHKARRASSWARPPRITRRPKIYGELVGRTTRRWDTANMSPAILIVRLSGQVNERLEVLRDALLPKWMSGKIDVSGISPEQLVV